MNIDFHYYVTYLAARNAGFSQEESLIIAHAAQYVDDSDESMLNSELLETITAPTPTVESDSTLARKLVHASQSDLQESEAIWETFHFLPGNFPVSGVNPQEYTGCVNYKKTHFQPQGQKEFDLMCLPNSPLSVGMVNDCRNHSGFSRFLYLIGIRMHTLADTWAHMYYSGVCSWWVNDVHETVHWAAGGSNIIFSEEELPGGAGTEPAKGSSINFGANVKSIKADHWYRCMPSGKTMQSYCYLGHGRMGHLPDDPFARYVYKPQWSQKDIPKDNPADFMKAYKQMIYAMTCIRNGSKFTGESPDSFIRLDEIEQRKLMQAFEDGGYKSSNAAERWASVMEDITGEDIPRYDKNLWLNAAREADDPLMTDYYRFNLAAAQHMDYVESQIGGLRVYPKQ